MQCLTEVPGLGVDSAQQIIAEVGATAVIAPNKEDYYAWNEDILSVGHGRVVAVTTDQHDNEIGEAPSPTQHPAGNFIVIQHGPRLFSVYAHLEQWTAVVEVGDLA